MQATYRRLSVTDRCDLRFSYCMSENMTFLPRRKIIPDVTTSVAGALVDLCDNARADLILTTGGTGPAPRNQTPEAMQAVLEKE